MIQALIDAIPPSGGRVVLDSTTYELDEPLTIDRNDITIEGTGGTVLKILNNTAEADYGVFDISNCDNIRLRNLEIDGNKAGQVGYVGTPALIGTDTATNIWFEDLHIYNGIGDGIEPEDSSDVHVVNCHIHDCDEHAIHFNGVTDGFIQGCHLHDDGNSLIAQGHGGVDGCVISDNILENENAGSYAIQVSANDAPVGMRQNCQVVNNVMVLAGNNAVNVAENASGILIAGNVIIAGVPNINIGAGATVLIRSNVGYADN